eukprot:805711-Rhodomonas_salina.2
MKIRKASPKAVLLATERLENRVAERVSSMLRGDAYTAAVANEGAYLHFVAMLADKQLRRVAEQPTVDDNEDVHAAHCNAAPGAGGIPAHDEEQQISIDVRRLKGKLPEKRKMLDENMSGDPTRRVQFHPEVDRLIQDQE